METIMPGSNEASFDYFNYPMSPKQLKSSSINRIPVRTSGKPTGVVYTSLEPVKQRSSNSKDSHRPRSK